MRLKKKVESIANEEAVLIGPLLILGVRGDNVNDVDNSGNSNSPNNNGEAVYQENYATCHDNDLSGDANPSLERVCRRSLGG